MDKTRRELERVVAAERDDDDARHRLTRSMARSMTGVVAYWPGSERPHSSAMRSVIGFEVTTRDGPRRQDTPGWILAVTTAEDVLEIAALRGGCRLIDLATWRIVGLFGQAESVSPRNRLQAEPMIVSIGDSLHARQPSPHVVREAPGGELFVDEDRIEDRIGIASGVSESLYDREVFMRSGTVCHYPFFQSTRAFSEHAMGRKSFGTDTNLEGNGGSLPLHEAMIVNGMSMLLDAMAWAAPSPITDRMLNAIYANSYVRLRFGTGINYDIPSRLVFPKERGASMSTEASPDDAVRFTGTAPAIYPFSAPIVIRGTQSFSVELVFHPDKYPLQAALEEAKVNHLGIMCVLHGTRFAPRSG